MSIEKNPEMVLAVFGILGLSLVFAIALIGKSLFSKRRKLARLGARVGLDNNGRPISIDFEGQEVGDDVLRYLRGMTSVERLWLNETRVTDEGLKHLHDLANLKELALYQTYVTDEGMQSVKHLSKLKSLLVEATKVTEAGVQTIKDALPNCRVRC